MILSQFNSYQFRLIIKKIGKILKGISIHNKEAIIKNMFSERDYGLAGLMSNLIRLIGWNDAISPLDQKRLSRATLASYSSGGKGAHPNTITNRVRKLEELGYLEVSRKKTMLGTNTTNEYSITPFFYEMLERSNLEFLKLGCKGLEILENRKNPSVFGNTLASNVLNKGGENRGQSKKFYKVPVNFPHKDENPPIPILQESISIPIW